MSQDAEDGPEIWINDQKFMEFPKTREPMNQVGLEEKGVR